MSTSSDLHNSTNVRAPIAAVRAAIHAIAPASPEMAARLATEVFVRPRRFRTPARERDALASARFARVPFGDAYLPTWTWGDDALPAVLLVHGWEGRGSQLVSFVAPIRTRGFRVVAFDGPGHGRAPGVHSSAVHIALAVERLGNVIGRDALAGIVAHSVGGAATALAIHASHGAVAPKRVVLVAPPANAERFFDGFCRELALGGVLREAVAKRVEREIGVTLSSVDVRACSASLHAPMLLLHDEADREIPFEDARTFVSSWPGSKLVVTSGLGHRAILRDPDVVAATAAFLAGEDDVATGLPFGSIERDLFVRSRRYPAPLA
jgi:pimeloyl-ACP methyl ester carboxylesterase